jgi:fumarate reductase subunit C
MELLELATGLLLFMFVQFHLFALSSMILGAEVFNRDSHRMDELYISYVGIPIVIVAILVHGLLAMRKAPWKFQEFRVYLTHSRRLAHLDTWAWGVQILTGCMILVFAAIHVFTVLNTWPINAATSLARVQGGYFSSFVLLLMAAEIHAMVGLYRILVKWTSFNRRKYTPYLIYSTVALLTLGFASLLFFYFRTIPKGMS